MSDHFVVPSSTADLVVDARRPPARAATRARRRSATARRIPFAIASLIALLGLAGLVRWLGPTELVYWLGKLHPALVHLPIGMIIAAAVAESLLMLTGRHALRCAAQFCTWLSALGAVAAVASGWLFAGFDMRDGDWVLTTHRWLGTAAAAWVVLVLVLGEMSRRSGGRRVTLLYRLSLFLGLAAIGGTGFLGGSLIYGLDHLSW